MPEPTTIAMVTAALFAGGAGVGLWLDRRRSAATAPPPPDATLPAEVRRCLVESQVLRAGLEDTLCHLVEIYGVDYLDSFLERRMRRNVHPLQARIERETATPEIVDLWMEQVRNAENILTSTVEAVRRDPSPPPGI